MRHIISGVVVTAIACISCSAIAIAPNTTTKKSTVVTHQSYSSDVIRPYIGVDYGHAFKKHSAYHADKYHFAIPNIGVRNNYIGLEGGYARSGRQHFQYTNPITNATYKAKTYMDGFHADVNMYLPVANNFELIGTAGFGHYRVHYKDNVGTSALILPKQHRNSLRLGIGAQVNLDQNISIRAVARHTDYGFKWKMSDGWMGTIGLSVALPY